LGMNLVWDDKDWSYLEIEQRTSISGTAKGRKLVKEALIYNY